MAKTSLLGNKYSKKAEEKISHVMKEFKKGKLRTGRGKKHTVKNKKQAIAIAIAEAKKRGYKVPQ